MKKTGIYLLMGIALTAFAFTSCSKDDVITPNEKQVTPPDNKEKKPEDDKEKQPETKHASLLVQKAAFKDYDKWVYIDLESGDTAVRTDYREWEYRQIKADGTYTVTKRIDARPANEPKQWHLAFHIYEPMTNDGEVMLAGKDTTSIDQITSLPATGNWTKDKKVLLVADMSGMMSKPAVMGYMQGYANPTLYQWYKKGGMGKYSLNENRIFIVKFKDGSYAVLKFTGLTDPTEKMKVASFDYKFIKKK